METIETVVQIEHSQTDPLTHGRGASSLRVKISPGLERRKTGGRTVEPTMDGSLQQKHQSDQKSQTKNSSTEMNMNKSIKSMALLWLLCWFAFDPCPRWLKSIKLLKTASTKVRYPGTGFLAVCSAWFQLWKCQSEDRLRDTLPEPHVVGAHHDVQHSWFNEQRWHEGVQGSVRHTDDGVKVINWSFHFMKTHQLYQWRCVNKVLSMELGCTLVRYAYSAREILTTNHLYVALILCDLHSSFQYVQ